MDRTAASATIAAAVPDLDAFWRRNPVLGLDRDPGLALNPTPEPPLVPEPVPVESVMGAGRPEASGVLACTSGI